MPPAPRNKAELELPPDIFGSNPQGLLQFLGLTRQSLRGDNWSVQLAGPSADLLTVRALASGETGQRNFRLLDNVLPHEVSLDPQDAAELEKIRERLVERASSGSGDDLAALFRHIQVELLIAGLSELASAAEQAHEALGNVTFKSSGTPAFVNRSAHLVLGKEELLRRVRLPAIIFRLDQGPNVIQRATAQMAAGSPTPEELVF